MTSRDEREDRIAADAKASFAGHEIRECGDRRWLIQSRRADGSWEGNYATEIIVGRGAHILVHGDIDPCVFGDYSGNDGPAAVIAWMGRHEFDGYVAEKASIGMGGRRLIESIDEDVFRHELEERLAACDEDSDAHGEYTDALDRLEASENCEEIRFGLLDNVEDGYEMADMGDVVNSSVIVAHAAIRRLHELLTDGKVPQ